MHRVSRLPLHGTLAAAALLAVSAGAHSRTVAAQQPNGRDSTEIRRDSITFRSGAVTLAATLLMPPLGIGARAPAVVLVHGSGTSTRENPWTTAYAEALARRGIIVLHPDKRGSGQSGGDWRTATFHDLARDAAAAVQLLRKHAEVDTGRIGVIGFSQGGSVVPIVAAEDPKLGLAAVISGGTMALLDQVLDEIALEAEREGTPLDSAERAVLHSVYRQFESFARTRQGWSVLQDAAASGRKRSPALAHALRTLPADSSHWVFSWIGTTGNFDPIPYWRRVQQPVLLVYGGQDSQLRPRESIARLWDAVGADAENFSIVLLQGNGHALFRDDLTAMLAEWIRNGGGT